MGDKFKSQSEALYFKAFQEILPWVKYEPDKFRWKDPTQHTYTPDLFLGYALDGKPVYLELKGQPDYNECNKLKWVMQQNPNAHFWVLLYRDSKTPNGKMWSDVYRDYHVPVCIGTVPDTWLRQLKDVPPDISMRLPKLEFRTSYKPSVKRMNPRQ